MNHTYGNNGEVKENIGKVQEYLGMTFDFTEKGKVKIKLDNYAERIIIYFPTKISKSDTILTLYGNIFLKKLIEKV